MVQLPHIWPPSRRSSAARPDPDMCVRVAERPITERFGKPERRRGRWRGLTVLPTRQRLHQDLDVNLIQIRDHVRRPDAAACRPPARTLELGDEEVEDAVRRPRLSESG